MRENLSVPLGPKGWPGAGCHLQNNPFSTLPHTFGHGRRLYIPWTVLVAAVVQLLLYDLNRCESVMGQGGRTSLWEKERSTLGQQNSSAQICPGGIYEKEVKWATHQMSHTGNLLHWHIKMLISEFTCKGFKELWSPIPFVKIMYALQCHSFEKILRFPSHFKT